MSIAIIANVAPGMSLSKAGLERAAKVVESTLSEVGSGYRSLSGQTLALGVAYCERRKLNYRITGGPGGYYIERLSD